MNQGRSGCRGFKGPFPPPLRIRVLLGYKIIGRMIPCWGEAVNSGGGIFLGSHAFSWAVECFKIDGSMQEEIPGISLALTTFGC